MRREFRTLRDYHLSGRGITVRHREWHAFRASVLIEESGDLMFREATANSIVMTIDGTEKHLTRMGGIKDETPSRPGEICLIPAGIDLHLAWKNHCQLQETFMLEFDTALFETYAPEMVSDRFMLGHLVPANFAPRPEIAALTRILAREVDDETGRGRIFAETAIRLISIEIATSLWSAPARARAGHLGQDRRLQRAVEFIEAQFTRDLSLLEIASVASLSPTHLTDLFRKQIGTTPYAYVLDRRVAHAIHLLRTSDMPIAHVALEAGFADQQHLTRMIRARHKRTPKQVRMDR